MRAGSRRAAAWVAGVVLACAGPACATPTEAWRQPAGSVRSPERAVYLAAARAGERLVVVGEHGLVAVSDDGGNRWRQVPVPVSSTLTGVQFVTPKVGWVIGHAGVVLATRDGGETWALQLDGRRAAQATLAAAQAGDDGSGEARRRLAEAQRLVDDGPDKPLLDLCFIDERVGFVVGAYNLILRTDDGGAHWQSLAGRLDNPRGLHLYAIAATGNTLYLAGEQGLLLRSDDAGQHFVRLVSPYAGSLFALRPFGPEGVVAAGLRGHAFVSHDRGHRWRALEGAPPVSFIAAPADGAGVWLLNQAGQRFLVQDDRLVPVPAAPLPPVNGALALERQPWLMLTGQGLLRQAPPGLRP